MKKIAIAALCALLVGAGAAIGQAISTGNEFATQTAGKTVVGTVSMFWNAALGYAQPASSATPMPVTESSTSPTVPFAAYSTDSITQVAGITFTANTAWNNTGTQKFFTLTGACRVNGGEVLIPQIDIWSTANPTLKLTGVLWLFAGVPSANIANNTAFVLANADYAITLNKTGYPFTLANPQISASAANSGVTLAGTTFAGRCPVGTTTISGMIEVTNAYVSTTGEVLNAAISPIGTN